MMKRQLKRDSHAAKTKNDQNVSPESSQRRSSGRFSNLRRRANQTHSKHRYGSRQKLASNASPVSPPLSPLRLRRLGVRQAEDQSSTTTESSLPDSQSNNCSTDYSRLRRNAAQQSKTMELLRKMGVSPSHKQLQQLLRETRATESEEKELQPNAELRQREADAEASTSLSSLNPLGRTSVLKCPVCSKMFLSFHGHDLHLDTHDNTSIKCWPCNLRFNSNKSLLQHQRLRHNKKRQAEEMSSHGFHKLIFIDFSCDKYPAIAQSYCENNAVQPACSFHNYTCNKCHKSFPIDAALQLHTSQYHYYPSKFICGLCNHDYRSKAELDRHKQAYAGSANKRQLLTDAKRRFIRALSLMPQCAAESASRHYKHLPAINTEYHKQLSAVDTVTKLFYASAEAPRVEDDDSDSSQS